MKPVCILIALPTTLAEVAWARRQCTGAAYPEVLAAGALLDE